MGGARWFAASAAQDLSCFAVVASRRGAAGRQRRGAHCIGRVSLSRLRRGRAGRLDWCPTLESRPFPMRARAGLPSLRITPLLATTLALFPTSQRTSKVFMHSQGFAPQKKDNFKYAGRMRPAKLSPKRSVPKQINKPDYADDGTPKNTGAFLPWQVEVKSEQDIVGMRAAGRVAREVLDAAGRALAVGVATDEIDAIVHSETLARGAYPSPLNYHGFPKSCCTSINEVICHGIPDANKLRDGDIINIDVTCYYGGYHGDCSETYLVGEVDEAGKQLVKVTHDCWQAAIDACRPGVPFNRIGEIIEDYIGPFGYSSVAHFCGHGIGRVFHTSPNVIHVRNKERGKMVAGNCFTIEPMICEGSPRHLDWKDGWTATTKDGKRSAQFEHTLLITPDGVEALTARLPDSPPFWWE